MDCNECFQKVAAIFEDEFGEVTYNQCSIQNPRKKLRRIGEVRIPLGWGLMPTRPNGRLDLVYMGLQSR